MEALSSNDNTCQFIIETSIFLGGARQDSSRKPAVLLVLVVDVVDDDVEEEEKEKKKDDDDDGDHGEKETTRMVDTLEYYWSCSSMPVIRV